MKYTFTPKRDYPILAVILIGILVALVILSNRPATKNTISDVPNDDIHKGLSGEGNKPSTANVSPQFIEKLNGMRKDAALHPDDTLKIRELADLLGQAHQIDEATVYYEKILRKFPQRTDILVSMAYLRFTRKEYDKSAEYLNRILKIHPDDTDAKFNLGALAAQQGKVDEARKWWSDIVKKHPGTEIGLHAQEALSQLK